MVSCVHVSIFVMYPILYFSKSWDCYILVHFYKYFSKPFFWLPLCYVCPIGGAGMCGESWLAVKDSLTHHPSSQDWASWYPLFVYLACTSVCYKFHLFVRFVMVGEIYVLFVWSVYCVSCLSGYMSRLPFFLHLT